jgi:uncharacterized protein DUF4070
LGRSILKQGLLGEARASYWKFFLEAATRYRHAFDTAITLAIMGYHFQTLTREVCQAGQPVRRLTDKHTAETKSGPAWKGWPAGSVQVA